MNSRSHPSTCSTMADLRPILLLHRGPNAYVTFHRKRDGVWQDLGSIAANDLARRWSEISPYLDQDAYFSINSTFAQRDVKLSAITGLPIYSRKADKLSWLNAVVVDIDRRAGKPVSFEQLRDDFIAEIEATSTPVPNLICSSGRGLWALWLLVDEKNTARPVRAFIDKREILQRVNRAVVKRFSSLGSDRASTDPSRVMRVPNSSNSAAVPDRAVVTFFNLVSQPYTLPQLAEAFGVRGHKIRLPGDRSTP